MLEEKDGRFSTKLTFEEIEKALQEDLYELNPVEREVLMQMLSLGVDTYEDQARLIQDPEFVRPVVSIEEFLEEDYFLGQIGKTLYPQVRQDLINLFSGQYYEAVCSGSIGEESIIQEADGGLPTLRERLGKNEEVVVLKSTGMEFSTTENTHLSGHKQVYEITLANGMRVTATSDHGIRTCKDMEHQWTEAAALKTGDMVVVPRWIKTNPSLDVLLLSEARLLGYWLANGSASETRARYCSGKPETIQDVAACLESIGFQSRVSQKGKSQDLHVVNTKKSGFWDWITRYDGHLGSKDAFVPECVCKSDNETVREFLIGVFSGDGHVRGKGIPGIMLSSVSERFIRQIQLLLLRFGIRGRIEFASSFHQKQQRWYSWWNLVVTGCVQVKRFFDDIGEPVGDKQACQWAREQIGGKQGNTNVDVLPFTGKHLSTLMTESGIARGRGHKWWRIASMKNHLSRSLFDEWLDEYRKTPLGFGLSREFSRDIGFEKVVKVERKKISIQTGDLGAHNGNRFIANGISVKNSIGWGKNTLTGVALVRMLYEMSCLKDPQEVYGLEKGSEIALICLSVTEDLAKRAVFGSIKTKIMTSKYFKDCFPYKQTLTELRFPGNIRIAASSSSMSSALSLNVFGGIIDEVNFMPLTPPRVQKIRYGSGRQHGERQSHAETLYHLILRRMKSRYAQGGKLPGVLMVVSSKSHTDAFTEKRISAARTDTSIFVAEHSIWEVKGHLYSKKTFPVFVGNERTQSRVLETEQEKKELEALIKSDPDFSDCRIIYVPTDFKQDFTTDLETSLQDLAGIATVSISPFIQRREAIYECIDATRAHPMPHESWDPSIPPKINWDMLTRTWEEKNHLGQISRFKGPLVNPRYPRHVHIDTSVKHDATGIAVAHVPGYIDVVKRDADGNQYTESAPEIYIDFMLRVTPPPGEDIIMADIRTLLYSFMDHGYYFGLLSTDQFQSVEMRQYFEHQKGVKTELVSVDRTTDPYRELRSALYENRISFYHYNPFIKEIQRVIHDKIKGKIDHIPGESKDVSDAIAGVVHTLTSNVSHMPVQAIKGISEAPRGTNEADEWIKRDKYNKKAPPEDLGKRFYMPIMK